MPSNVDPPFLNDTSRLRFKPITRDLEKRRELAETTYKEAVNNLAILSVRASILIDLYHVYSASLEALDLLLREHSAGEKLRPGTYEVAAVANVLARTVRGEIEKRITKALAPDAIVASAIRSEAWRAATVGATLSPLPPGARVIEISQEREVFYAKFDGEEISRKADIALRQSYAEKQTRQIEALTAIQRDAKRGLVQVYGSRRDYAEYNEFAKILAADRQSDSGYFQFFVDPKEGVTNWKEKQVDVLLTIRAMELLHAKSHDFIVIIANDTDFEPILDRFAEGGQNFIWVHIALDSKRIANRYASKIAPHAIVELDMRKLVAGAINEKSFYEFEPNMPNARVYERIREDLTQWLLSNP